MGASISFKEYYSRIDELLVNAKTDKELFEAIVNAPFHNKLHSTNFDLGMIVLTLVNKSTGFIDRITYSKTSPAMDAVNASPIPFKQIKIPLDASNNITVKAIQTNEPQKTSDWQFLFTPLMAVEAARFNQLEAGMDCSFVYPLKARQGGALIFSFYQDLSNIKKEHQQFMSDYTNLVSKRLSKIKQK